MSTAGRRFANRLMNPNRRETRCGRSRRHIGAAVVALALVGGAAAQQSGDEPRGLGSVAGAFFAVRVPDIDVAADWYATTLRLDTLNRVEAEDGSYRIRILGGGGLVVELIEQAGTAAPPNPHLGLFKAGFHVDDIDAAFDWLRGRGVDTDERIFVDEALAARSFVFRDPFGNRLQVFQRA